MDASELRQIALRLPEAVEEPHFEKTSFRVAKKIFATVTEDGEYVHVFVDEAEVKASVAEDPTTFEELWWGKKLSGVRVRLATAGPDVLAELLEEAWRRRAPKKLQAELDQA